MFLLICSNFLLQTNNKTRVFNFERFDRRFWLFWCALIHMPLGILLIYLDKIYLIFLVIFLFRSWLRFKFILKNWNLKIKKSTNEFDPIWIISYLLNNIIISVWVKSFFLKTLLINTFSSRLGQRLLVSSLLRVILVVQSSN